MNPPAPPARRTPAPAATRSRCASVDSAPSRTFPDRFARAITARRNPQLERPSFMPFHPSPSKYLVAAFIAVIPRTVRSIAVLDRTKEPGAVGEPLYQDVLTALAEHREVHVSLREPPAVEPNAAASAPTDPEALSPVRATVTFGELPAATIRSSSNHPSIRRPSDELNGTTPESASSGRTARASRWRPWCGSRPSRRCCRRWRCSGLSRPGTGDRWARWRRRRSALWC